MNIRLEDLPEDTHQLVEIVGMEKMIEIVKSYGGDTLYIPMYSSLVRCDKTKKVVKEYNGKNGRAGLQIDIFKRRFYEPTPCISLYLEKH